MSESFLKDFPLLRKKILGGREPETVFTLESDMWEQRIEPLISELETRKDVKVLECTVETHEIRFMGNDQELIDYLAPRMRKMGFVPKPHFNLYVFSGLIELSILRRFKDFPDETGRDALEEFWAAECPNPRSAVILNRNR